MSGKAGLEKPGPWSPGFFVSFCYGFLVIIRKSVIIGQLLFNVS
jgi:hypothetical protein